MLLTQTFASDIQPSTWCKSHVSLSSEVLESLWKQKNWEAKMKGSVFLMVTSNRYNYMLKIMLPNQAIDDTQSVLWLADITWYIKYQPRHSMKQ